MIGYYVVVLASSSVRMHACCEWSHPVIRKFMRKLSWPGNGINVEQGPS